jgi:hypothetical protein
MSAAGQKVATWAISSSAMPCAFLPKFTKEINIDNGTKYGYDQVIHFFFGPDATIDFTNRIYNVTDSTGQVIETGPVEITAVLSIPGYSGKIHHYEVSGYKVMDQ